MRKIVFPVFAFLSLFLITTSFTNANGTPERVSKDEVSTTVATAVSDNSESATSLSAALYKNLNLENSGLSEDVLTQAIKGYEKLLEEGVVHNTQYLTIVDLSQSSRKKRLYLLDVENQKLALNTFVSHGKNSGLDKADRFSNVPETEQSSLGFYVTKQTYSGKHGLSLKLSGLEQGFNNNAEARGIVVHGAEYVNAGRVHSGYMGRSQGCPAVPEAESAKIINMIKDGSVLFIYHPTENYLKGSKLLNS